MISVYRIMKTHSFPYYESFVFVYNGLTLAVIAVSSHFLVSFSL